MMPFYLSLGAVAVIGIVFIARQGMNHEPPLTAETTAPIAPGPRGVSLGPDSAPVKIMEFSDFECPWCGQFATLQMPDVRQRLLSTGKVQWTFMNFPLNIHAKSPYAHLAAACANEQGKFWEMHDLIYQHQGDWTEASDPTRDLADYATQAGLDRGRYDACMKTRSAWGHVLADKALGDSLHLGGTPTFFINGREWKGNQSPTVDQLIHITDSLTGAGAPPARPAHSRS
jgi:protein-disulfide isomerase